MSKFYLHHTITVKNHCARFVRCHNIKQGITKRLSQMVESNEQAILNTPKGSVQR